MVIKGYKAFNKDKTNRYGSPFEEGCTYTYNADEKVRFGNFGVGFHFCTELADVFRYFPNDDDDVLVAKVTGTGKYEKYDDEYYGYYDMYVVSSITIDRFLTREEIINHILNDSEFNVKKFLATFRLNEKEKLLFLKKFVNNYDICRFILYFQFGFKSVFEKNIDSYEISRRLLKNGQDNN